MRGERQLRNHSLRRVVNASGSERRHVPVVLRHEAGLRTAITGSGRDVSCAEGHSCSSLLRPPAATATATPSALAIAASHHFYRTKHSSLREIFSAPAWPLEAAAERLKSTRQASITSTASSSARLSTSTAPMTGQRLPEYFPPTP